MLDSPQTDFPLFAPPHEPVDLAEYAAGFHAARTVADGGTLQIGIGSLGDAVAQALILRHRRNSDFRTISARLDPAELTPPGLRQEAPFDAGLHGLSEMFVEGFLDLIRAGVLKREVDGALLQAAFFLGSRAFYRALREMPEAERAKLRMTAVSYVNELYGDEPAKRRARVKARFINNAMMATLLGAVISDALEDGRVVSGVGGQYNFVAQGFALEGARSVIILPATRTARRQGQLEHPLELRPHHHPASSARHRGDRIWRRRPARQIRPRRDRRHAGGHGFALPGRTAAARQGRPQDRARIRTAGGMPRQHARAPRACAQAGGRAGAHSAVSRSAATSPPSSSG